jgi:hypothetical protein
MLEPVQQVDEQGQPVEAPAQPEPSRATVSGGRISLGSGGRFGKK